MSVTPVFLYPLPSSTNVPDRSLRMKDGRYIIKDPTSSSATKRTRMLKNSQLTQLYASSGGLVDYIRKETVYGLHANPELASMLVGTDNPSVINTVVEQLRKESYGSGSKEFSTALHAWLDHVEYQGKEEIPAVFEPYITEYLDQIRQRGWRFDPELSHRWITDAGVTGILPDNPVFSSSNRVYRTRNGGIVSLRTTTSANVSHRMAQYMADAGFAARATEYLLGGKAGTWTSIDPKWQQAQFGVGVISRDMSVTNPLAPNVEFLQLNKDISTELAQSAYDVYASVHSKTVAAVIDAPASFEGEVSLEYRISHAQSREELDALWQANTDRWTDEHTKLGMDRLKEIEPSS